MQTNKQFGLLLRLWNNSFVSFCIYVRLCFFLVQTMQLGPTYLKMWIEEITGQNKTALVLTSNYRH